MKSSLHGLLNVSGLELQVNLGWRNQELMEPQAVMLDFAITYANAPAACTSDHLEDTLCYAVIIEEIRAHLKDKKYRLIEHLSNEIYKLITPHLPTNTTLSVTITKKPKIDGLLGGVSFTCFNDQESGK